MVRLRCISFVGHLLVLRLLALLVGEHRWDVSTRDVEGWRLQTRGLSCTLRKRWGKNRLLGLSWWTRARWTRLLLAFLELLEWAQQRHLSPFLASQDGLAALLQQMDGLARLLRQVWHGLQLFPPCFRDLDWLLLRIGCLSCPSHLVGVAHDLAQVLGVQRIQDAKEVVPWWALALIVGVGEVLGELDIFLVLWPQSFDGELVILGNFDREDGVLLEELLLTGEDLLEEVLVNVTLWW